MLEQPAAQAMRHALWVCLQLGGPPLVAMLLVGVIISLLQAVLLWLGPFMGRVLQGWALQLFDQVVALGGLP